MVFYQLKQNTTFYAILNWHKISLILSIRLGIRLDDNYFSLCSAIIISATGLRTVNRGTVNRGTIKCGQLIAGQLIAWTHNRSDN